MTTEHTPQKGQVRPVASEVLDSSAQRTELQTRITGLQPKEFAQLLGISTRTLALWRADGRFRPISLRKQGRGYQFHADWALADAQEVSR